MIAVALRNAAPVQAALDSAVRGPFQTERAALGGYGKAPRKIVVVARVSSSSLLWLHSAIAPITRDREAYFQEGSRCASCHAVALYSLWYTSSWWFAVPWCVRRASLAMLSSLRPPRPK